MRKGFQILPDEKPEHNEMHRKCFMTPYCIRSVSSAPTADELEYFELVYCTADDKLYTKNDDGTIVKTAALS